MFLRVDSDVLSLGSLLLWSWVALRRISDFTWPEAKNRRGMSPTTGATALSLRARNRLARKSAISWKKKDPYISRKIYEEFNNNNTN